MAPHKLFDKRRSTSPMRNDTPPTVTTPISSPSNAGHGRTYFRQCLDVVNLLLIGLFVFKACTDIKPCAILATTNNAVTVVEKPTIEEKAVTAPIEEKVEVTPSPTSSPTPNLRAAAATSEQQEEEEPPTKAISVTTADADEEPYVIPIDYRRLLSDGQTVVVVLASSGLGSNIIQLLAQKLFYNDRKFNFIVDDSQYGYKWDDQTGMLNGFFDPHFPVLKPDEYRTVIQEPNGMAEDMGRIMANAAYTVARSADQRILVQWAINESFRTNFQRNYGVEGVPLYDRFVAEACTNLQFNPQAKRAIKERIQYSGVPDLRRTHSVAFHVRRGDKVTLGESRAYSGSEYVDKLVELRDRQWIDHTRAIEHCFVASDDLGAVEEVRQALQAKGFDCQFHTLATRNEDQAGTAKAAYNQRDSTVEFLAEVSLLLDATYFIGTFNSNVGSLAAILRKCHYYGAPHYAHSYGVDREGWFYRA